MASPYLADANQVAAQYGIPSNIFAGLIDQESSWNPNAQAKGSTAYGLTQLIAGTAKDVGVTDITKPLQQLEGGAKYLSQQYKTFGNWTDALAAYNQGPGGVNNPAGQYYAKSVLAKANNVYGSDDPTQSSYYTNPAQADAINDAVKGDGSDGSPLGWIKNQLGNVGFVVAGIAVLGIALVLGAKGTASSVVKAALK